MKKVIGFPGRLPLPILFFPLLLLLLVLVFAPVVQAEETSADHHGFYYLVQPGDTLYKIATRYGSTIYAI